jgi:hypothetical protein
MSLNDVWTYYFHDPNDSDWTYPSYQSLANISSIEDFWSVHQLLKDKIHMGMFFLMREHIFPCWDDKYNCDGGCLSIKVLKQDLSVFWEELSIRILGENLLKQEKMHLWNHINGMSISPKKHFCIVKVWLQSGEISAEDIIVPNKFHGNIIFKPNKDTIDKNNTKCAVSSSGSGKKHYTHGLNPH